ncbi:MAG: hypothetical protein M3N18_09515 [Actinomycetota bacterium]|nr:hypothetical protein [Actinomycetota bacterium]
MVRRMQLLEVEGRFSTRRAAAIAARIREGLLRDNKVVPPVLAVLAVLAILIFAWLAAGVLVGEPGEKEEQRASNQASLGQRSEEDLDLGQPETPAPEAENRDADSFAAFEPKDPFRELIPKAGHGKAESKAGEGKAESKAGETKSKAGESKSKADDDFMDQTFPGVPDPRSTGDGDGGSGQGVDRGGSGNLLTAAETWRYLRRRG